jgi:hypothetical protein
MFRHANISYVSKLNLLILCNVRQKLPNLGKPTADLQACDLQNVKNYQS